MPGLLQSQRKRSSAVISDDDDDEAQSDQASTVSVGSKRARRTRDAFESPSPTSRHANQPRTHTQNSQSNSAYAEEQFPPGSLVRVKLKNFVTYTAAEFHLGPSLNMIIGPNGTGKSTLVCAICLGLGWASEHLGRAKEIGLFVKNGSAEAEIEIELAAGLDMDGNPVVRRIIRKEDNKSIFWINGRHATKNAVLALCKQFSIQIDNLCQFLPQDRVVEFAKMTDVDRLRETQRAAAPPHMVEWHDQLKGLRSDEKILEMKQQNERRHLASLESAQAAAQDDVNKFEEREGLLKKSKCLEKVKPIIELSLRKADLAKAKQDLQAARRELDEINAGVEPVRRAQGEVETYRNQINQVVELRKNRVDMIKSQADKLYKKIETEKQAVVGFAAEISGEANSKKERERDIARTKADIQKLEHQLQGQRVEYDPTSYDQRKAELRTQASAAQQQLTDRKAHHDTLLQRARDLDQESKRAQQQRQQLNTQSGKQASVLAQQFPDTAKAWDWFLKNRNTLSLKGEVCGPPILECSVKDQQYAQAVESMLREGDRLAITFTNAEDQRKLSDIFLGKGSGQLGLEKIFLRFSPKTLSEYQPPIPRTGLPSLGFEGYVLDYIQGPDQVLAMLCDNARLHRIGYASRPISGEQYTAVSNSPIQKWVSGKDIYQITTRREYGASSTAVTQFSKAMYFVDQPANTDEIRQLDDAIKRIGRDVLELKEEGAGCRQEIKDLEQQISDFHQARQEIQTEQDALRKAIAEWAALPDKIQRKQEKLNQLLQENATTSDRIRAIKASSRKASIRIATTTLDYTKCVTQLRMFHEFLLEAEIRLIEAQSESNALQNENREILEKQQRKQVEIGHLHQQNETLRNEYRRMLRVTQNDLDSLTPEEKETVQEYRRLPNLEALEQEIAAVTARLEMMAPGNSGVLKAYQKRAEDIAKTREKLEEHMTSLESTRAEIIEIREQWEPQLDVLMAKISDAFAHNFQQIGCAGEVRVYKDEEDFDNWSIQISVRFREGETLSVLNSHRQSGGERAVSTIFYLMALQDLAQSPFRVVDEINQGMDPRNERMVHERMVDIACQERTSQYFLITPKLLTGLKFHPKMKVHVINSGEHVPDAKEAKTWDLRSMAKIALRQRKGVEV